MSTTEWGPRMWRILHVIGERHTMAIHNALIISFLENLHNVLPCVVCQKHCATYWVSHRLRGPPSPPPPQGGLYRGRRMIGTVTASSTTTWNPTQLREWLWIFHNNVNTSKKVWNDLSGSEPIAFPFEGLEIYKTMNVREDIEYVYALFGKFAIQHSLNAQYFRQFRAQLDRLRAIYRF